MRRFVMEHGDFSRAQGVVTKHVNVMSALSEQVGGRHLMDVSTVGGVGAGLGALVEGNEQGHQARARCDGRQGRLGSRSSSWPAD
jgi:hypothetical protein